MITKSQAEELAKNISRNELDFMFRKAAKEIKDWKEPSRANPRFDRGAAWNMLFNSFLKSKRKSNDSYRNYIWCFGEYLPNYIIKDGIFLEPQEIQCSQDPNFSLLEI